jgi:hypothetical protein
MIHMIDVTNLVPTCRRSSTHEPLVAGGFLAQPFENGSKFPTDRRQAQDLV